MVCLQNIKIKKVITRNFGLNYIWSAQIISDLSRLRGDAPAPCTSYGYVSLLIIKKNW